LRAGRTRDRPGSTRRGSWSAVLHGLGRGVRGHDHQQVDLAIAQPLLGRRHVLPHVAHVQPAGGQLGVVLRRAREVGVRRDYDLGCERSAIAAVPEPEQEHHQERTEDLPIHDESHVRNAIARFNQTDFESDAAKERARKKILAAAERHGIEVDSDSNVREPAS